MIKCVLAVFLVQVIYVNSWVFNNIGIGVIKKSKFGNVDSNELDPLEPTSIGEKDQPNLKISLIYPGKLNIGISIILLKKGFWQDHLIQYFFNRL